MAIVFSRRVVRISETVSVKRKRGRPRAVDFDQLTGMDRAAWRLFTYDVAPTATRRTWRNYELGFWAYWVLLEAEDPDVSAWGAEARPTVLTELGRLGDPATIVACARRLAECRPTAREAVAWLRGLRHRATG